MAAAHLMERPIPQDPEAEKHLIGACLVRRDVIGPVSLIVDPADFAHMGRRYTFTAILDLWNAGEPVDAHSVRTAQHAQGLGAAEIMECQFGVPATGHAERYARVIVEHHARRRLINLAGELATAAYDLGDPGVLIDSHRSALASVALPAGRLPGDLASLDDMLDAPEGDRAQWVIPGMFRTDWRVIVVAKEGEGKSLLLQQIAVCAAQGIHPMTHEQVPPVRVLMVDLENPEDRIVAGCTVIRNTVRKLAADYDPGRVMLWHRPGGIDLRTRSSVAEFEAVLEAVRPQLVVMGPAYKASTRHKGEGWDEGAAAVQRVLDGMRTRFGFALLMEDHAPQAGAGGARDLRPFGSSLWLRWPEIGLKLVRDTDATVRAMKVERWRGDRLLNKWPSRLLAGVDWPWVGEWPDGRTPTFGETVEQIAAPWASRRDPLEGFEPERKDLA